MEFSACLKSHMQELGCTAAELADAAGMPRSSVSRYLSGRRTPDPNGDVPARLSKALASLATRRDVELDADAIRVQLSLAAAGSIDYALFSERLRNVMDTFGIAHNGLARSMDFDPSYISRILSGQRRPADMPHFVEGIVTYVARNHDDAQGVALAAELTGVPATELASRRALADALRTYLVSEAVPQTPSADALGSFLKVLDSFDLNDFLKNIHFDDLKVPTSPFQLPTSKTYEGIEQMKQAELDFLKAAVLSRSTDDVILYSDMPLEEMAEDREFPRRIMAGMALLLRKGIHLHNIHNVHRPLTELIMGLEGWLPICLTGQMSSYWLPATTNDVFLHFIRSAGSVAVSGEAIAGNQGGGRYVVTKHAADVAYLRRRAEELLAHARPLIRVWRGDDQTELEHTLHRLERKAACEAIGVGRDTFANMTITVWPRSHALIEKERSPRVSLLVEHPALVDALERYEPTLF